MTLIPDAREKSYPFRIYMRCCAYVNDKMETMVRDRAHDAWNQDEKLDATGICEVTSMICLFFLS